MVNGMVSTSLSCSYLPTLFLGYGSSLQGETARPPGSVLSRYFLRQGLWWIIWESEKIWWFVSRIDMVLSMTLNCIMSELIIVCWDLFSLIPSYPFHGLGEPLRSVSSSARSVWNEIFIIEFSVFVIEVSMYQFESLREFVIIIYEGVPFF